MTIYISNARSIEYERQGNLGGMHMNTWGKIDRKNSNNKPPCYRPTQLKRDDSCPDSPPGVGTDTSGPLSSRSTTSTKTQEQGPECSYPSSTTFCLTSASSGNNTGSTASTSGAETVSSNTGTILTTIATSTSQSTILLGTQISSSSMPSLSLLPPSSSKNTNLGLIIGVSIGGFLLLTALVFFVLRFLLRRRRRARIPASVEFVNQDAHAFEAPGVGSGKYGYLYPNSVGVVQNSYPVTRQTSEESLDDPPPRFSQPSYPNPGTYQQYDPVSVSEKAGSEYGYAVAI